MFSVAASTQRLYKAAAPEMISMSSPVMTACLVLLKVILSLSIISVAFLDELSSDDGLSGPVEGDSQLVNHLSGVLG